MILGLQLTMELITPYTVSGISTGPLLGTTSPLMSASVVGAN